jgi:hypothetical protein
MGNASDSAMHQHRHEGGEYRRIEMITGVSRRRRIPPGKTAQEFVLEAARVSRCCSWI